MTTHQTILELTESVPPELEVGASVTLKLKVSCPEGCDLSGIPVKVVAQKELVITSEADLVLKAPAQAGEQAWTILFPRHESGDLVHEERSLVVSFTTRPHTTSMAVWDVPSPVVMNRSLKLKVGVKCSAACPLGGQLIEVCNETGARIGESRLDETPWPGTSALHVAEVEMSAPDREGVTLWSARFAGTESELAHTEASAGFSFRTARAPEHKVTVKVTEKDTEAPLENVDVRLGVYSASTDAHGLAILELPGGVYDLDAWKAGYETSPRTLEVGKDLMVYVEAVFSPVQDPDDTQVWM